MAETDCDNLVAEKLDLLFEKRKAVREAALVSLNKALATQYCGPSVESRCETITDGIDRVLRDQQKEPMQLALRTAALASLSLPSGHGAIFTKLNENFRKIVSSKTQSPEVKAEAVNALAMSCFMSAIFDVDHELSVTLGTLTFLQDLLFSQDTPIQSDISSYLLNGWILLASTLPDSTLHEEVFEKYFEVVNQFMNEEFDITVRVSSAKAVAVLLESEREFIKETESGQDPETADILDQMLIVFEDKAKFKGKVELKRQRSTLKSIISYVQDDKSPTDTILIRNYPLVLNTWKQILRMDYFRYYLGEGFTSHLEENGSLMFLFDYHVDVRAPVTPTMTKKERRLSLEGLSKAATKVRSSMRAIREQEMGYGSE